MDFPTTTAPRRQPALVSVDGRTYPLRSATLRARASGGVAATTLIQEFANPHDEALEVLYTLPLPADGAVLGYTIHVGERVIRGEIEPREKAEADYRKALYEGKTAGLLEEDRADTFSQKLGNIPPHTDVRVEIETLQRLAFLAGLADAPARWEYRFPTVATVRYQGAPGRVPDAGRISPDRAGAGEIPTRFELDLSIADESAAGAPVASPSHAIRFDHTAGATIVKLEEGSPLDRDLVVRWRAATREVGVHLTEGPGLSGDDGRYALLTITPPEVPAATFRRDLTVLLDTSGSMKGEPISTAKQMVARLLGSLEPEDRFEVLVFSSEARRLTRDLVPATEEEIQSCLGKMLAVKAEGGTEMTTALLEALKPKDLTAQRQVVLVTDGQIGFESEAFEAILQAGSVVTRVHVVGIGAAPNRELTSGIARAGRGAEVHASNAGMVDEAARRIVAATAAPVLVGLEIQGDAVRRAAPERPADVFAGQPLVMAVELDPKGGPLQVSGQLAGSEEKWIWRIEVPAAATTTAVARDVATIPMGALFGRERIADIELRTLAPTMESMEGLLADLMGNDVEAVAMRHRIVSRRTSLVAIAEEPSVDPKAPRRRERLAVEVPYGMSADALGLGQIDVRMIKSAGVPFDRFVLTESRGHAYAPPTAGAPSVLGDMIAEAIRTFRSSDLQDPKSGTSGRVKGGFTGTTRADIRVPGTLIRHEGGTFIIEFEVPFDGFTVLHLGWSVRVGSEGPVDVSPVYGESSPTGPQVRGTLIRLALARRHGDLPAEIDSKGATVCYVGRSGRESVSLLVFVDAPAHA